MTHPKPKVPRQPNILKETPKRGVRPRTFEAEAPRSGVGERVAREKRDERERRRSEQTRTLRLRITVVVVVAALVVSGITALYRSQLFDIRTVEVLGASRLTPDAVRTRAAVPDDATLLRYPEGAIKERLLADAWIANVQVTRNYPHTLRIRVTERVPVAIVDTGDTFWVVDGAGFVLGEQSLEETSTLVVVRDIPGLDLKSGRQTSSEILRNALLVLVGITDELHGKVRAVSAPSIDETTLITSDNVEVLLGEAIELPKKDIIVLKILREQAGAVVFIDVRNTERPVSRGLEE
ncbi:MAG: cell division protein FtsQ/DivIB [Coriobacteriia bacterium]